MVDDDDNERTTVRGAAFWQLITGIFDRLLCFWRAYIGRVFQPRHYHIDFKRAMERPA